MHVVFGATGQTGAHTVHTLLNQQVPVRAVVRDLVKAQPLADLGAEIVLADVLDAPSLRAALQGAESAFVLNPPNYQAPELRAVARQISQNFRQALHGSGVQRVAVLSSIGAHLPIGTGNILTNFDQEQLLAGVVPHVTFLRCAWFMDNWAAAAAAAAETGLFSSLLAPLDAAFPMVSSRDIGRTAGRILLGEFDGEKILELEGPHPYSPRQVAETFRLVLNRPVQALAMAEVNLSGLFTRFGFSPDAVHQWVAMVRAFNQGYITWEGRHPLLHGTTTLEDAARELLAHSPTKGA